MVADSRKWTYATAIGIAMQLAQGLLDKYPLDKAVAERQLRLYVEAGDVTWKELEQHGYSKRGLINGIKEGLCTIAHLLLGRLFKWKERG